MTQTPQELQAQEMMTQFQHILSEKELEGVELEYKDRGDPDLDCDDDPCDEGCDFDNEIISNESAFSPSRNITQEVFRYGFSENGGRHHQESKLHYFNVERTDNPYIMKYTEVEMENLSDNFKITKEQVYQLGYCFHLQNKDGSYDPIPQGQQHVVPYEVFIDTLKGYKEQLLVDKNKVIIDPYLLTQGVTFVVEAKKQELGLSIGKDGRVTLKKEYKSKAKSSKPPTISKGAICHNFKYALQGYAEQTLGFPITITVRVASLYKVLTAFKTLFPNTTYDELCNDSQSYYYQQSKEAESMWNDPSLAKPVTKKPTKKEKK